MAHKKTVYILGAGASASAGIPTQAGILPLIFSINRNTFEISQIGSDILSLSVDERLQRIADYYDHFDLFRQTIGEFVISNFSSVKKSLQYKALLQKANSIQVTSAETQEEKESILLNAYNIVKSVDVALEDVFTIFDSVATGREHFRLYSPNIMDELHKKLKMCIIYALSVAIATCKEPNDYSEFCTFLVEKRLAAKAKDDPFSIITTNWDDLLERKIYDYCEQKNKVLSPWQQKTLLDLCFYNYDLSNNSGHIPSTQVKAKGHRNIKVLKMHGSLAWLECPRCNRIFTDFSNEIASEEFSEIQCPLCSREQENCEGIPKLRNLIITPTFLKSLDNLNIKNIWQNAFIDINEANEVVFIGYSLPDADFEMRCLLKKAIRQDAKVTVILRQSSNPERIKKEYISHGYSTDDATRMIGKMDLPSRRYATFFGEDRVNFYYKGFRDYIESLKGVDNEQKRNEQ